MKHLPCPQRATLLCAALASGEFRRRHRVHHRRGYRTAEPTAITVGEGPSGIVILPDGKRAYTLNSSTISVIDLSTNQVTTTIDNVGNVQSATVPALTPDGKYLYVPVFDGSSPGTVVVISTEIDSIVGTPIPVGNEPLALAIAPSGKRAYVSNYGDNTVTVISIEE
jgi:YVTN family beta-propeller protein